MYSKKSTQSIPGPRPVPRTRCNKRGTALVLVFFVMALMVGLSVSLLQVGIAHTAVTDNTRDRQQAQLLAQAGFSTALSDLNLGRSLPRAGAPTTNAKSWGIQQKFAVTISLNADGKYTIDSVGTVMNTLSAGNTDSVQRRLQAVIAPPLDSGKFSAAAFGKSALSLTGVAHTDSYDSGLGTTYAQQVAAAGGIANYDSTIGNKGNVASNGTLSASGSSVVHGDATPGSSSTVTLTGGASVTGSTAPAAAAATLTAYEYNPTIASAGAFSISSSDSQIVTAGTYRYSSWNQSGQTTVTFTGTVNLYIDGDFSQSGQSVIALVSGAKLNVFQGAAGSFSLSGQGVQNQDQIPSDFNVVSASTRSVNVTGQGSLYATLYAPDAAVSISGQGEFFGAVIGNDVTLSGMGTVHYDKSATSPGIHQAMAIVAYWEIDN